MGAWWSKKVCSLPSPSHSFQGGWPVWSTVATLIRISCTYHIQVNDFTASRATVTTILVTGVLLEPTAISVSKAVGGQQSYYVTSPGFLLSSLLERPDDDRHLGRVRRYVICYLFPDLPPGSILIQI